ncbi:MAG: hypothetical protein RQ741_10380 [Wenzhouxiangellaceae bacterium]|nr:hypothetical protein [Wenzhouxiangellaceae bacterium]
MTTNAIHDPGTESPRRCARPPTSRRDFPKFALAGSLAAHVLLGLMLLHTPLNPIPSDAVTQPIMMRLLEHPTPEPVQPSAPEARGLTPPDNEAARALKPMTISKATAPRAATEPSGDNQQPIPKKGTETGIAEPATALRAAVLQQIGDLAAPAESNSFDQNPWASYGDPIRGLPGARGWLSGYVGAVPARTEQWQDPDGRQRARHVLADGTVVCVQRRASTIDEAIHPWKSTIVSMASSCGRERPAAPEFSNPRSQPAPTRPDIISEARISGR